MKKRSCLLDKKATPFRTEEKISTTGELYSQLKTLKKEYGPYLTDMAPSVARYSEVIKIKNFLLDGEEIENTHYSVPIGDPKQVYTTTLEADFDEDKAVYIYFKGADYYAVVYVNGVCVGTNEGFFSPFEFEITDVVKKDKTPCR